MVTDAIIDIQALQIYKKMKYTLIPLHKWDEVSKNKKGKKREDGKRPLDKNWTMKHYDVDDVLTIAEKRKNNIGVRLTASQLVIDVDPRNMPEGRDTFKELCKAIDLNPLNHPTVETGSGGLHLYLTKPADIPVVDTIEGYDGVEFKTKGRQVVAAGSKHPNGNMYNWDFLTPDLDKISEAPVKLLNLIRRPKKLLVTAGGGEHDQTEILHMLNGLDPEKFRDHSKWLTLMMACHHASNGDARSEFIEWSTRDPQYVEDAWIIGRRWDSLYRNKDNAVTFRTLHKVLRDANLVDLIPVRDVSDDFDSDLTDYNIEIPGSAYTDDRPDHEKRGLMTQMNETFILVIDGGKTRIMFEQFDPSTSLFAKKWVSMKKQDFELMFANRKIEKQIGDKVKIINVANAWLEWHGRRTAHGVLFDPEREHPGYLNLWQGWSVDPAPGDWSLMKELIETVLCDGNEKSYEFVYKWIAYMVQKPRLIPEVAICFHGDKGTGKSTLGKCLCALTGAHGVQLTSSEHISNRFNAYMQNTLFLFSDEAVVPTDRENQNKMKGLITEKYLNIEAKRIDLKTIESRLHVMIASNHDWFVDAGATDGERRYFISRVNNSRQKDFDFFRALHDQMYGPDDNRHNKGLKAMLHDLQLKDITNWTPRDNIPVNTSLTEQKLRNLEPIGQWWFNGLDSGELPFRTILDEENWKVESVRAFIPDVKESFEKFCIKNKIKPGSMNKSIDRYFWGEFKKVCPNISNKMRDKVPEDRYDIIASKDGRARSSAIPSLEDCRENFEKALGCEIEWD